MRFNRNWNGWDVAVEGILADINLRSDGISMTVNDYGIDYVIGVECYLDRNEATNTAVAELDPDITIRIAGTVVPMDDWRVILEPCGVLDTVQEESS